MAGGPMYSDEEKKWIELRLETCSKYTQIAKDFIINFDSERTLVSVETKVQRIAKSVKLKKRDKPIKRLFFDIETGYHIVRTWRTGKINWLPADNIIKHKKIICISWKWQFENEVHTLKWTKAQDDRTMIKRFIKVLGEADEIVGHNGDRFDIKELRTRAIQQGLLMWPNYRTFDTLKKARKYFNFASNKLDYLGQTLNVGRKLDHEGMQLWINVQEHNNQEALEKMIAYCEQDVLLLEDVFHALSPWVDHNTNYAVLLGGEKYECPNCTSGEVQLHHTDTTPKGWIHRWMSCSSCMKQYKISNKSYSKFLTDIYRNAS